MEASLRIRIHQVLEREQKLMVLTIPLRNSLQLVESSILKEWEESRKAAWILLRMAPYQEYSLVHIRQRQEEG